MLRFPYLLSLILCIQLSFCYSYIDDAAEKNQNRSGRNVRKARIRRARRPTERKSQLVQEYDYDRSPVEFDVASFIQPDEEALEDDEPVRQLNKKRRRTSRNYDYGKNMGINDDGNKKKKTTDFLNIGDIPSDLSLNPPLFKDSINMKRLSYYNPIDDLHTDSKYAQEKNKNMYKNDLLQDQNLPHNPTKKCSLKHIKFPFFSHNKSEPLNPKKNKKRKLFRFSCPKKEEPGQKKLPKANRKSDDTTIQYKMKRSYEERLCPACKKIYLANLKEIDRPKKTPKRIIHNSRQFYQSNYPETKEEMTNIRKSDVVYLGENNDRMKRYDESERQLKELEEVQQKIDNAEIHLPTFKKPAKAK